MNADDLSKQQLLEEIAGLREKVAQLETAKAAFNAQTELITTLSAVRRTANSPLMLKALLQQSIQIANRIANAEDSSLFLFNRDGVVVESILARGATIREEKQTLIGKVLEQGLAGWVSRNHQVGLIDDTMTDDRWVKLPQEPYKTRSALCIPILKGKTLLGIATLMHSQPGYFSPQIVHLMEAIARQIALVLDLAWLYLESPSLSVNSPTIVQQGTSQSRPLSTRAASGINLSKVGIYILMNEGKFLYANSALAEIFGYTFSELVALESFDRLAASSDRQLVAQHIEQCLQGQISCLDFTFSGQRQDGSLINVNVYGAKTKFYGKSVIIGLLNSSQ